MTRMSRLLGLACGAIVIAALIVVPISFNRYGLYILSQWAVMTIAAMGLNLTLGYAGQVSLAQGAFVGIGAYTAAILTTHGIPLIAALAVAIVLCVAIGWLPASPPRGRCRSTISASQAWQSFRSPCGGSSARPGAAPSWHCARIRSGRCRSASTRAATR